MPRAKNPFFRFKDFTVWQHHTALKVCTEACILGAYAVVQNAIHVLDIGTGTGLLALMLAQRAPKAHIEAVEINAEAAQQALSNVQQSVYAAQIKVTQTAVQDFEYATKFDLIVCNPPFFSNHLLSAQHSRNAALHTQTLSFSELAAAVGRLLAPQGRFVVLLPAYQTTLFMQETARVGLFPTQQLTIFQKPNAPIFRLITTFEHTTQPYTPEMLYIHQPDGSYSDSFRALLQPYYLHF
jgi:tRNA1Val (adenine37-N6)-methyltransferase